MYIYNNNIYRTLKWRLRSTSASNIDGFPMYKFAPRQVLKLSRVREPHLKQLNTCTFYPKFPLKCVRCV